MIIVKPEGAPACCRSEREFLRAVHTLPGVLIANANVPASSAPGAFTREVDAILLTRQGVMTVEVKGLRAVGELHTPRMDAWTVVDGETSVPLMGRPHGQALSHSKYLSSFLKAHNIAPGWIPAVLAIVGEGIRLPDDSEVTLVENVHVIKSDPHASAVIEQILATGTHRQELSLETVQSILTAFECVASAPSRDELVTQGFRSEKVIAAEVDALRAQARSEFLAAASTNEDASRGARTKPTAVADIANAPTDENWLIDEERFRSTRAIDADLTEVGAVINGVPMHRRLVAYATRKEMDLADVAAVVNQPVEILGDEAVDTSRVFCGDTIAVSVRTIDNVALFYKPVHLARAEKQGIVVNDCEITPRAAKQAINQFDLPLEAVARIVAAPQDQWWINGTTDVAHARGDFVAVTSGPAGPVQYLMTRAVAIARALSQASQHSTPVATDLDLDGLTLRAAAVAWCHRRQVPTEVIAGVARTPTATWPGHSEHMQVRCGEQYAVLVDTDAEAVVAVMTAGEAAEYRDGVTKEGLRFSGRSLFLAKRRKVSIDDLIAAYRNVQTIARRPGVAETVYIGLELAVVIADETQSVVEFTFARHARSQVARGDLIAIDTDDTGEGAPISSLADVGSPSGPTGRLSVPSVVGLKPRVQPISPSPLLLAKDAMTSNTMGGSAPRPSPPPSRPVTSVQPTALSHPRPTPRPTVNGLPPVPTPSGQRARGPSPLDLARRSA